MPLADLDHNDYLTEKKVEEIREAFELQADRNGLANEDGLAKVFRSLGKEVSHRQLTDALQVVDIGGSGSLGFEEFCVVFIRALRYWPRPDLIDYRNYLDEAEMDTLDQAFRQRDLKGLGRIDLAALNELLVSMQLPRRSSARGSTRPNVQVDRVIRQAVPSGSRLDFAQCCAIYAVLAQKRRRLNYREFLSADEVCRIRKLFEAASSKAGTIPVKGLEQMLGGLGVVLTRQQIRSLMQDFDLRERGRLNFEELCVLMCRIGKRRRQRLISPSTCDAMELWREEKFTIQELLLSGFKLPDLREAGIQTGSMYKEGVPIVELRRAGLSAVELRRAGLSAAELRGGGFSLADLRLAGFSDALVCEANRKLRNSISDSVLPALPQLGRRSSIEELHGGAQGAIAEAPVMPVHQPPRHMTAVIRERMDYRPWRSQGAFHLPSLGAQRAAAE